MTPEGTSQKNSRAPLAIFAIALILLYSFGFYNLIFLTSPFWPIIVSIINLSIPWLVGYGWAAISFVMILILMGFLLAYLILHLMKRAAAGTLRVLWLLQAVLMFIIGIVLFILLGPFGLIGLIFPFIGIIQLWVWFRRRQKIERAGKLVEFTATLLLEEREMFIVPLGTAFFSLITGVLMLATYGAMFTWLPPLGIPPDSWLFLILSVLMEIPYLFVYFTAFYLLEGINVSVAHTWYRKEDPILRGAVSEVREASGTIVKFAGLRTLVAAAQSLIRQSGQKAGGIFAFVGAIFSRIIGAIFRFVNYFTLPAIIIEKRGLKDSIKRSIHITWHYLVDVYIAETGVSTVFSFFGALLSLAYLAIGFLFGYVVAIVIIPNLFLALLVGFIFAIVFAIFAAIPSYFIFRPLNTAYRTFMFSYAMDEESGFKLPSRLPKAYRDTIEQAQAEWEASGKDRYMEEPPSEW